MSSTRLSEKYGYTNDHISRLCRQGKVPGQLVSRAWFVDEDALVVYFSTPKESGARSQSSQSSAPAGGLRSQTSGRSRSQTSNCCGRLTSRLTRLASKRTPYFPAGNIIRDAVLFASIFVGVVSAYGYSQPVMREAMTEEMLARIVAVEKFAQVAEDKIYARMPMVENIAQKNFSNVAAVSGSFSGQIVNTGRAVATDVYITLHGIPGGVKTKTKNTILSWLGLGSQSPTRSQTSGDTGRLTSGTGDTGRLTSSLTSDSAKVIERVVERVIEKPAPFLVQSSGIGKDELEKRLQEVDNALRQEIYRVSAGTNGAPYVPQVSNWSPIAVTQKIDQLSGVTITNATFSGTGTSFNLTDADVPDGITASNYLLLSGGTLTGAPPLSTPRPLSPHSPPHQQQPRPPSPDIWMSRATHISVRAFGIQAATSASVPPLLTQNSPWSAKLWRAYFTATTTTNNTFPNLVATNSTTTNATTTSLFPPPHPAQTFSPPTSPRQSFRLLESHRRRSGNCAREPRLRHHGHAWRWEWRDGGDDIRPRLALVIRRHECHHRKHFTDGELSDRHLHYHRLHIPIRFNHRAHSVGQRIFPGFGHLEFKRQRRHRHIVAVCKIFRWRSGGRHDRPRLFHWRFGCGRFEYHCEFFPCRAMRNGRYAPSPPPKARGRRVRLRRAGNHRCERRRRNPIA